jgi:hypothetical protein
MVTLNIKYMENKVDPSSYLKVVELFLDRMLVKKIIPIPYENAINEVKFDMYELFPDEENKQAFDLIIKNLQEITDLEGWYKDN